jgi:hypothetical protein
VELIYRGMVWPDELADDDDPAVAQRGGAKFGYFVARNAASALSKMTAGA